MVLAQTHTHRSMEQNREHRNQPIHMQTLDFWQFRWKVTVFPTNGSGTTGYPYKNKQTNKQLWSILNVKPKTIKLQKKA